MRVPVMAVGGTALAIAASSVWWFHSVTADVPLWPKDNTQRPPQRLSYTLDTAPKGRVTGLVNQDRFAWNDVRVEIGEHQKSFRCPTIPTVGSGQTVHVRSSACRSADGSVPMIICVVRLAAKEGSIVSGFEPCLQVE